MMTHNHSFQGPDKAKQLDDYLERCMDLLKDSGSRVTSTRRAVMRCLAEAPQALSPKAILELMKSNPNSPAIDLVTIYRILNTFAQLGLIHQVAPAGEFMACTHLDCSTKLHALTRCQVCGNTEELDVPADLMLFMMKDG